MLKIVMIGNLGKEPEMRFTPGGQPVTNISVADTRRWTTGEEKHEETTWYRFTAWGKLAETIHTYLHKGSKVYIEARPRAIPEVYTNSAGVATASNEGTILSIEFLSANGDRTGGAVAETADAGTDIPF